MSEKKNNLVLSVAIITYNQEKFISQTLDSILNQEHNYPYEIVIGEDCSTDGTKKIIEEYVQKYPEIIKPLYNNPNKGLIKNYFNVIAHCSGKYIMECAGDDYWLPGKVQKQIDFMEANSDVGMCYGLAKNFDADKNKFIKRLFGCKKETIQELLEGNNIPALSVCMRRELLNKYIKEIKPQNREWMAEDYPEWLWFSANSKIHFMNNILGVYRVFSSSACHFSKNIEKQISFYKNLNSIKMFFSKKYSIPAREQSDEELYFYAYVTSLQTSYSKKEAKALQEVYKNFSDKGLKEKIYYYSSKNIIFWKCLLLLKKVIL